MGGRVWYNWNGVAAIASGIVDTCVQGQGIGGTDQYGGGPYVHHFFPFSLPSNSISRVHVTNPLFSGQGTMNIFVWQAATWPEEVAESAAQASGACEESATCETAASTEPVCRNGATCTSTSTCGDSGCSCVAGQPQPDIHNLVTWGSCGLPSKRKRSLDDPQGPLVDDLCLCNATFVHQECCYGGKAINGLLEL